MLKITYITHSSFFLETDRTCLLFDYYTGTIPKVPEGKKMKIGIIGSRKMTEYGKRVVRMIMKDKAEFWTIKTMGINSEVIKSGGKDISN